MQQFAHISDPHLTSLAGVRAAELLSKRALGYLSWHRNRRHEHRPEVLAALKLDLRQRTLAQLLVTGDLTHIGLPMEFVQAAQWLRELGEPTDVALVPGNHDACVRAPWEQTFGQWLPFLASDEPGGQPGNIFPSLRVRGDLAFIGVSTAVPKPPLLATGTAGAEQIRRLSDMLEETGAQGLFRVVFLHHCPLVGHEKWRKRLTDAAHLESVLAEQGVELVLHGHGHRRHRNELPTRAGNAPVIAVPSASALGLHGKDVAGYNCYTVAADAQGWTLTIEERRYNSGTRAFAAGARDQVALTRTPRAA